jgi:hypothetical protein
MADTTPRVTPRVYVTPRVTVVPRGWAVPRSEIKRG